MGRADFDRTLERLPGLRLVSFSSKDDGIDCINRVELEFRDIQSLIPFLGGTDPAASFVEENGKKRLSFIIYPGAANADPELLSIVQEVSQGYSVSLSLSAPGGAELGLTDGGGKPLPGAEGIAIQASGKTVSLSLATGNLLAFPAGLGVEFTW